MATTSESSSLETINLALHDLGENFVRGLDTITRAIHECQNIVIGEPEAVAVAMKAYMGTTMLTTHQQNQLLANMVREKCVNNGFMSAWGFLMEAAPNMGLHWSRLVEDIHIAANMYQRIKKGTRGRALIDLKMAIGSRATYDSIYHIGPKSLGGNAWKASEEYKTFLTNGAWIGSGYTKGLPPCVLMGWIGVQMKVTPAKDALDVVRLQLLGTVDFDLDYLGDNKLGFQNGFDSATLYTRAVGTGPQGAAFIGMLNYDFQNHIRPIQNQWAATKDGPFNLGPADVSPQDWAAYLVADCAALVPFAYDKNYNQSRAGMANGMIHLQCQDLLFDTACSNRVATVPYAEAAGVAQYGIHAAYASASYEATARYFLDSLLTCQDDKVVPPFGYSACMVAGPWGPYGTRYRVWERCVKYIRQLQRSNHPEAKHLLELSSSDLILKDYDPQKDVGDEWARAMESNASDMIRRPTTSYYIPVLTSELFDIPGVEKPNLCEKCAPVFEAIMASNEREEVHAIGGLPSSVTVGSRPASLAVGLRRAALWACNQNCCDTCASRVGYWADAGAYMVMVALMQDEPLMGPSMWMLQNYFVGCVAFWPIGLPFLLSGFDLLAHISQDEGAMGARDVVDI